MCSIRFERVEYSVHNNIHNILMCACVCDVFGGYLFVTFARTDVVLGVLDSSIERDARRWLSVVIVDSTSSPTVRRVCDDERVCIRHDTIGLRVHTNSNPAIVHAKYKVCTARHSRDVLDAHMTCLTSISIVSLDAASGG